MSIQLRPYQREALDALFAHWATSKGSALIDLPTGTGKSVVIAELVKFAADNGARIVIATHVRELVAQNHAEFVGMYPEMEAVTGINSASLKSRDVDKKITFASIQSIYKNATDFLCGGANSAIDLIVVDEAHLMPRNDETMYRQFLKHCLICNPDCRLVGLTATPYRMDSGSLVDGDGKVFDNIVYTYNVGTAIEQGYLAPVTTRATKTHFDLSGVGTRGGEFIAGELERAVDKADVNTAAVQEIIKHGADRESWIVFCTGVNHAEHIASLIRDEGYSVGVILGDTPSERRSQMISDFKAGKIRCLCGVSVLTTGFNAPRVDLIAMLRPTQSPGLYVQIVGRGTRLAPGKKDCLVLDFAENITRHGPIDDIRVGKKKKGEAGDAPVKTCPECETYVPAGVRFCPECSYEFPKPAPKITEVFSKAAILKREVADTSSNWLRVTSVNFRRHKKTGSPDSLLVEYACGVETFRQWICLEHFGFAQTKARQWWTKMSGGARAPVTITEALERQDEIATAIEIQVRPNGKYTEVFQQRPMRGLPPGGADVGLLAATG